MLPKNCYLFFISILFCINAFSQQIFNTNNINDSSKKIFYINQAEKHGYPTMEYQTYLDSALSLAPNDAQLWQMKAMPYFKCRKYEVGMQYLNKAVEINSREWLGYRAFIKCIFSKNYNDALTDYFAVKKLNGNMVEADHPYSFYMGICYLQLNKFDSAVWYLTKTCETELSTNGESGVHFMNWFYLGIANYELKNYSTAINYFDKTLKRYENFAEAKYYKSWSLFRLQLKKEEASKLFKEAMEDFKKGYSITEYNTVYEQYPYQLSKYMVR